MNDNIFLAWLYFKTKTGEYIAKDIVLTKAELKDIARDSHIMSRCFRDKLEKFKNELVIDKETNLPKLLKVEWKKKLGI